jgi:hypothetical protein
MVRQNIQMKGEGGGGSCSPHGGQEAERERERERERGKKGLVIRYNLQRRAPSNLFSPEPPNIVPAARTPKHSTHEPVGKCNVRTIMLT